MLIRPRDVQFMRNALLKKFEPLLPDDDLPTAQNQNREGRVLSRALAATAVQCMTGFDPVRAVETVIDGENDNGIDAIAVADDNETIVLVQAKWSFAGKSSFDTAAAHKLVAGLRLIELRDFARFNKRILPMISPLESVLPYGRIELVIAVNGPNQFTKEARQILDDACSEFNSVRPFVSYRMVSGAEVIQQIQKDIAPKPIDISVFLPKWLARPPRPNIAYTGWVSAESAAGWFEEHGTALFRQNLRSSLGRTHVNDGIMTTLVDEPDSFWNYNNGITVLCRSVEEYFPGRKIEAEPIRLELSGASIINGAQTLTAIHATWKTNPQEVQLADVPITVIVIGPSDTEIANTITANRNTQNHVERRDLVALDPIQGMIWNDFASSLSKSYVYKRVRAGAGAKRRLLDRPRSSCTCMRASQPRIALSCTGQ